MTDRIAIQGNNKITIKGEKKQPFIIFLDVDGCVADWLKAACKTCNFDIENQTIRENLKFNHGDINVLIRDENLWKKIDAEDEKWWIDLDLLPWAKQLYEKLKKESDLVVFLTSPSRSSVSASGKVKWIQKYFDNTRDFIITKHKHLCASPNSLLIDDTKKKLDKFIRNGGNGFYWPDSLSLIDKNIDINKVMEEMVEYIHNLKMGLK